MKINLSTPYFFGNEIKNLNKSVKRKWISSSGSASQDFENKVKKYINKSPLKRMATEEDIVGSVVFLSSDLSKYITGHNLVVDGGYSVS